ncbi:DUF4350 domain-containing protein [Natronococcus pandeyae]|uniref:DUF4350 domain-containing protein n=1 Tax=Natronococcus pandeyae TaxID=2055836 RepID=A0A8J8Q531_9EURY|nr:DUF4350 domain-containing protein [Natronococcus pandeyae]TYL38952.1 DUF4350 domain-containing protein [Natronococcus pandeyae]
MSADRPRLALVAFGVVVLVTLAWVGSTSSVAYDPYNPGDDGTSELRQQIESEPGLEYETAAGYDGLEPDGTVAITAPSDDTDETDVATADDAAASAETFVRDGGTLVVVADSPEANAVLSSVGAEARLDGQVLRDDRHHYRGPAQPIATDVADHALTADVDRLGLNHATAVEPNGATVLANSSEFSYLVDDPDATLGEDERPSSHPVATVEDVGDGTVIVVGDSALATNEMLDHEDNARLLTNASGDADRVVVVSSDADGPPPLSELHSAVLDRVNVLR